jgi:hypothetical protein
VNRLVASAVAGAGALMVLAGAFAGGYALHSPKPAARPDAVTAPSGSAVLPCCIPPSGSPFPVGDGACGPLVHCTAVWQPQIPNDLGTLLVLTAPDGRSSTWTVASHGG